MGLTPKQFLIAGSIVTILTVAIILNLPQIFGIDTEIEEGQLQKDLMQLFSFILFGLILGYIIQILVVSQLNISKSPARIVFPLGSLVLFIILAVSPEIEIVKDISALWFGASVGASFV